MCLQVHPYSVGKKSVLGKLESVPLGGTFIGPKNSPLRRAVLGGQNLILGLASTYLYSNMMSDYD